MLCLTRQGTSSRKPEWSQKISWRWQANFKRNAKESAASVNQGKKKKTNCEIDFRNWNLEISNCLEVRKPEASLYCCRSGMYLSELLRLWLNIYIYIYIKVEHLITKRIGKAHINRLPWYHDPSLHTTADMEDQIYHDSQELQIADKFLKVQHKNGIWKIQVQWIGF